jgi:hypothetical protein
MDLQRIENWGVIGTDRLAGRVYNRLGHADGGMIVTSPVIEIRMMGGGRWPGAYPMAFTESGSAYRLGKPSGTFPMEQAQAFLYRKLNGGNVEEAQLSPTDFGPERTIVQAVVDTNFQNFERIELDARSFRTSF